MEVEIIKKSERIRNKKSRNISKELLNVAAYARVSTDMEEQQSSFISQQKYYFSKISSNPNWCFVEVYADEGISGTLAKKRTNFMRMIKDAEDGKIDLILTKSISRFARNTLDTLNYVRLLKSKGVGIIFEEENINTLDMAGELLLTVLASVAQQESETISSHVRLGFKMKKERGEIVGRGDCYGYSFNAKTNELIVVEDEAKIIKMIFKLYLEGFGGAAIAKRLEEQGILSPRGAKSWCVNTIRGILKNEKYIGDVAQGKTYTVDSITHKRAKNNGEEDRYYIKDHHEAIISREDFEQAQKILKSRNNIRMTGRRMTKKFTFSGRFRCGFCGRVYIKKSLYKKRLAWDCISVAKGAREFCPDSKLMHQDVIESCFMEAFELLTQSDGLAIESFIDNIKEAKNADSPANQKKKLEDENRKLTNKHKKLIDLFVEGKLDSATFEKMNEDIVRKIEYNEEKQEQVEQNIAEDTKIENGILKMKQMLIARESSNELKEFDDELFEAVVDYGIIGAIDENGKPDSYVIRFICKNGFNLRPREDITEEKIIENNKLGNKKSIYTPVVDFISNQHFFIFERVGSRLRKTAVNKVRVRVEIEKEQ